MFKVLTLVSLSQYKNRGATLVLAAFTNMRSNRLSVGRPLHFPVWLAGALPDGLQGLPLLAVVAVQTVDRKGDA